MNKLLAIEVFVQVVDAGGFTRARIDATVEGDGGATRMEHGGTADQRGLQNRHQAAKVRVFIEWTAELFANSPRFQAK
ncbi:hypothetical protein [Massilia sp. HP4]|uniref:hypothetical protein n=1 Tax=Massilia sp. HP4 TaxID=2562316 RepID=UPI0019805931|nr:hypothetical protein [Massilia sp. HP4]